MTPSHVRRRRGFTLIEVLVGLALLALVVSLIQGVYSGVARSRERLVRETEGAHAAAILLQRLSDELAAAVTFDSPPRRGATRFVVESDTGGSSRLEFTAPLPEYLQAEAETGAADRIGLARIGYSVEKESDGSLTLARSETRDPEADLAQSEPDPVLRGIVRFRVLCSVDGKEWEETWNSEDRAPADSLLPKMVSVEIAWKDPDRANGPERVWRTAIPVYKALG